ncbi:MAG: hypothetical protein ACYTG0_31630 [Planctomycetota bacterium]|jgi:hypothetical protein
MFTFLNPTPVSHGNFGRSVEALGMDILISAHGDDTGANEAGVVHKFRGVPEPSTFIIWSVLATLGITVRWWRQ